MTSRHTEAPEVAGTCIGFGEHEGRCENDAGDSPWSKLWCLRCDRLRLDHITAQMGRITARFEEAPRG